MSEHKNLKILYSEDELHVIYKLARLSIEAGDIRKAHSIFTGLNTIAPTFIPGWLGSCFVALTQSRVDNAIFCARQVLRINERHIEAMIFLVISFLTNGDINSAGTYLGEIQECIESGSVLDPHIVRLYKIQLARYQLIGNQITKN